MTPVEPIEPADLLDVAELVQEDTTTEEERVAAAAALVERENVSAPAEAELSGLGEE